MDFLINYVIEYLFFDGEITILKGVLDLLSFSEPSHWNMIFLGFIIGILVRRFSNKIKSWWLLSYPIIFFVAIYPLSDTFTVYDKKNLAVSKEIVREMNYDYDQWKRKNPRGTINPEWVKELDKEKESLLYFKNSILIKLSNQFFYMIFLVIGFLCKKYTFRNAYYNFKSAYKRNLRESENKKEQEIDRISSEQIEQEQDIKNITVEAFIKHVEKDLAEKDPDIARQHKQYEEDMKIRVERWIKDL